MRLNVHPWIIATTSVALACGWIVLGEHSDEVLHEWLSMPDADIEKLRSATVI